MPPQPSSHPSHYGQQQTFPTSPPQQQGYHQPVNSPGQAPTGYGQPQPNQQPQPLAQSHTPSHPAATPSYATAPATASTPATIVPGATDTKRPAAVTRTPLQNLAQYQQPGPPRALGVGDALTAGFRSLTSQIIPIGALSLIFLVIAVIGLLPIITAAPGSQTQQEAAVFGSTLLWFLIFIGGMTAPKAGYDLATQGRLNLATLFTGFNYLTAIGVVLIMHVCTSIGSQLFVIPGLLVSGILMFSLCSVFHRKHGAMSAIRESYQITSSNLLKYCGANAGLNLVAGGTVSVSFLFLLFVLLPLLNSGLGLLVALAVPLLVALCVAVSIGCAAAQACLYLNAIRERDALTS